MPIIRGVTNQAETLQNMSVPSPLDFDKD